MNASGMLLKGADSIVSYERMVMASNRLPGAVG